MTKTKIERLMAIKEEFARTQARLEAARKLEEAAQPSGMATLLENDLDQAELILAAQDMMHKLQNMAEDLAKMNAQDLFPLVDKMKAAFGQEGAHAFEASAQEVITQAMNAVRHAKDEMGNAIMRLEGKMPANDMAAGSAPDMGASDMATSEPAMPAGGEVDAAMDDFGGADAASGPEQEPLGRARKESVEAVKAPLNEAIILETAGRKLIETEGLESLIAWVLKEAAAGMPEEHFRTFATSVAQKAAKDPVKLAGWIGKKKHGMAAMAQLAEPTYTASPDLSVVKSIEEGKSFKRNDDDDDNWSKKSKDVARKDARRRKNDDKVDEGKTYKANDDDDDNWSKKSKDVARKSARRNKEEKVDETVIAAHAIAQLIEASIKKSGKGNAAKAVKEAVAYLAGQNLVEGDVDLQALVLESFQAEFGMKPAAYSVLKLREFIAPMSSSDKKAANSALAKLGGEMGTDKSMATKSVSSAMANMDGQERSAANKMLNQMKTKGEAPKNAGEFAQKAAAMVDGDDETNESFGEEDPNGGWTGKVEAYGVAGLKSRPWRKTFKDGRSFMAWLERNEGNVEVHGTRDNVDESLDENINAAHWPIDSAGQYKGEPFQTDYQKLKPLTAPKAAKTEGGEKAAEPKADEVAGSKAPAGEKKSGGNPFAKKEEPKAEEPKEDSEDLEEGFKDKVKKAAMGVGAAAALATGAANAQTRIDPTPSRQVRIDPELPRAKAVRIDPALPRAKPVRIDPKLPRKG